MALERLYTIVKGHIIKSVRLRMKNRRRLISQEHLAYGTAATHHLITPPATVLADQEDIPADFDHRTAGITPGAVSPQ